MFNDVRNAFNTLVRIDINYCDNKYVMQIKLLFAIRTLTLSVC